MTHQSRRLDFSIPVIVSGLGKGKWTCQILELNPLGLLIEPSRAFIGGENVTLHLLRDNLKFTVLNCEVGVGIEKYICLLSKEDENLNLDTYFSSFSKYAS